MGCGQWGVVNGVWSIGAWSMGCGQWGVVNGCVVNWVWSMGRGQCVNYLGVDGLVKPSSFFTLPLLPPVDMDGFLLESTLRCFSISSLC